MVICYTAVGNGYSSLSCCCSFANSGHRGSSFYKSETQWNCETLTWSHICMRALPTLWDESWIGQILELLGITLGDFELYERLAFLKLSICPQSPYNFVVNILGVLRNMCVCVCMYVCIYIYIYFVYIYICIYIYTPSLTEGDCWLS